jgi:hypothetical protein
MTAFYVSKISQSVCKVVYRWREVVTGATHSPQTLQFRRRAKIEDTEQEGGG